jgi:hypothetical protein
MRGTHGSSFWAAIAAMTAYGSLFFVHPKFRWVAPFIDDQERAAERQVVVNEAPSISQHGRQVAARHMALLDKARAEAARDWAREVARRTGEWRTRQGARVEVGPCGPVPTTSASGSGAGHRVLPVGAGDALERAERPKECCRHRFDHEKLQNLELCDKNSI